MKLMEKLIKENKEYQGKKKEVFADIYLSSARRKINMTPESFAEDMIEYFGRDSD